MTDIKAECLKEAERIARPHNTSFWLGEGQLHNDPQTGYKTARCTCGRDAEVLAIATALEAMYERGKIVNHMSPPRAIGW